MEFDPTSGVFRLNFDDRTLLGIADDAIRASFSMENIEHLQDAIEDALEREREAYLALPDRELMAFPMLDTTYEANRDALRAMRAVVAENVAVEVADIDAGIAQILGEEEL